MTSELEKDIDNRIQERLKLWAKDSIELTEIAGIPFFKGATMMASSMLTLLTLMFVATDSDPDEVAEMMRDTLKKAKELKRLEREGKL